ncbi:MAG: RrF2 family transcriptional regulator [Hydrogenophaga sp.]|uniref:RrF2 family transcriptional regulator n=1 Tax=Hydrogenophaga sp. TaxID=1904254 RepID=UPI003D9BF8D3
MRLTQWTDYSLRVLLHCAAHEDREQPTTIGEIAQAHDISRSHLTKIVMTLAAQGLIDTSRGRGGGMRLKRPASTLSVGEVVRLTETDFQQVECFNRETNSCPMDGACGLKHAFGRAMSAYLAVLDQVTLAELVVPSPSARARDAQAALSLDAWRDQPSWRINVER